LQFAKNGIDIVRYKRAHASLQWTTR